MSKTICRTLRHLRSSLRASSPTYTPALPHIHPYSSSSSSSLGSIRNPQNEHSFRVTYFINSCGFPPEKALSASKYVKFEDPDKPDSVLAFFRNHGFTKTQISYLVRGLPPVLLCDPEKTLLPKVEFFKSKGIPDSDIAGILTIHPTILKRSLDCQIIPTFDFIANILKSEEKTITAIKLFAGVLSFDLQRYLAPNIQILREYGVPEDNIGFLLTYQPRAFMTKADKFRNIIEEVKKMGFNPLRLKFMLAIHAMRAMTKTTWEKKIKAYKKWGLSEDEILKAFGKHPWCMMASEDKIMGVMDFLVNKRGWDLSLLARRPVLVTLSLKKRIVPRCAVYEVLLSKGLVNSDTSLTVMLESSEESFLRRFVTCHGKKAPELMKLYREKLDLAKCSG